MQRVKMEAAKSLLEKGRKSVFEIMVAVGYNDERAFRDILKRIAGLSPADSFFLVFYGEQYLIWLLESFSRDLPELG
jgi:AraC-like DNA-binding protein